MPRNNSVILIFYMKILLFVARVEIHIHMRLSVMYLGILGENIGWKPIFVSTALSEILLDTKNCWLLRIQNELIL